MSAIEFLNTRRGGKRGAADAVDGIRSYRDLVQWATQVGSIDEKDVPGSKESAAARAASLALSLELRSAFENFLVLRTDATRDALVVRLNDALLGGAMTPAAAVVRKHIEPVYRFRARKAANVPCAIAMSILVCLQTVRLETIKRCEAQDCIWFFIDTTKNGSRRWCISELCGARYRARRHYHKIKTQ